MKVLHHRLLATLLLLRLGKGTYSDIHAYLALEVFHLVVQLLARELLPLQVLVQLRVVLLHDLRLGNLVLRGPQVRDGLLRAEGVLLCELLGVL
jgi:hypothetical protein